MKGFYIRKYCSAPKIIDFNIGKANKNEYSFNENVGKKKEKKKTFEMHNLKTKNYCASTSDAGVSTSSSL